MLGGLLYTVTLTVSLNHYTTLILCTVTYSKTLIYKITKSSDSILLLHTGIPYRYSIPLLHSKPLPLLHTVTANRYSTLLLCTVTLNSYCKKFL